MNIKKISIVAIIIIILVCAFTGWKMFGDIAVRLGLRNNYFNYFNSGVVTQVSMQSTRDPGFKIVVTEPTAIQDVYKVLSKGRVVSTKSSLEPDYIVSISEGDKTVNYDYVADTSGGTGNFYRGDQVFHLSDRLDNQIIQNLTFIQKPRDFNTVYYDSILDVLKLDKTHLTQGNPSVSVNILDDYLCTKFLLSVDIQNFLSQAKEIVPNITLMNHQENKSDIVVGVQCYGFTTKTFKTIITVNDRLNNIEKTYYVQGNFDNSWNIEVFNSMPQSWNN